MGSACSNAGSWSGVPAIEVPGGPAEGTDGDDGRGQGEVGIDARAAALGAATESTEVVEPGIRPLHHPPLADLYGRRRAAVGDLAAQAALVQGLAAGPVVI